MSAVGAGGKMNRSKPRAHAWLERNGFIGDEVPVKRRQQLIDLLADELYEVRRLALEEAEAAVRKLPVL